MPGKLLLVLDRMMKAHTTESEKTDNHVFSVYISIASVKENRVRFSAQLRIRSASAAYNALPCIVGLKRLFFRLKIRTTKSFGTNLLSLKFVDV